MSENDNENDLNKELSTMFNNPNLNNVLNKLGKGFLGNMANVNNMRTDVSENDNEYRVNAELPGFKKNNIHINYNNNTLTINAKHDANNVEQENDDHMIRKERSSEDASRSFYLPDVDLNNRSAMHASYDGGVLRLVLPKVSNTNNNNGHQINID